MQIRLRGNILFLCLILVGLAYKNLRYVTNIDPTLPRVGTDPIQQWFLTFCVGVDGSGSVV